MCLNLTCVRLKFILDYCSGNSGRQPRAPITDRVSHSYHRSNYKPEPGLSKNGSLAMLICGLKLAPTSVKAALTPPVSEHTHIHTQTIPTFSQLTAHLTLLGGPFFPSFFIVTYYYGVQVPLSSNVSETLGHLWNSKCLIEVSLFLC